MYNNKNNKQEVLQEVGSTRFGASWLSPRTR